MKHKIRAVKLLSAAVIAGSVCMVLSVPALADNIGQLSREARVLAEATPDAVLVENLESGYPVRIIGQEGDYLKISYGLENGNFVEKDAVVIEQADGMVIDDAVNVRDYPSLDGQIIAKVNADESYPAKAKHGEWYQIEYNGQDAYIHSDFFAGELLPYLKTSANQEASKPAPEASKPVQQETVYAVVQVDTYLNLRSEPSLDSEVVLLIANGTVMDVIDVGGEWVNVSFNGNAGYVNLEFVSVQTGVKPQETASSKADEIITYAKKFLGTPYKYAGNDLSNGVDCSGFVYNVMKPFGVSLNRSSSSMINNGYKVEKAQLSPCDLVFFSNDGQAAGTISHVGIYIGNNQFIHSSSSSRTWGVVISGMNEDYYIRNYVTARRVLN